MAAGRQQYVSGALSGAGIGGAVGGPVGAGVGAGIGLIGAGLGLFGDDESEAQAALVRKQEQMAREARAREDELRRAGLASMAQTMGAFAPRNAMMAQMFGPEAAFSGEQMANMTADPAAIQGPNGPALKAPYPWIQDAYDRGQHTLAPAQLAETLHPGLGRSGPIRGEQWEKARREYQELQDYARQREEWEAREGARRANFAPGAQGPAPIAPTQPAPARRY